MRSSMQRANWKGLRGAATQRLLPFASRSRMGTIGHKRSVAVDESGSSQKQLRVRVERPVRPHRPRPVDRLSDQVPTPTRRQLQRAAPETLERRTLGSGCSRQNPENLSRSKPSTSEGRLSAASGISMRPQPAPAGPQTHDRSP